MAPEVLRSADVIAEASADYGPAADVYSFGLLLWEVMHKRVPFAEHTGAHVALVLAPSSKRPPLSLPAGYGHVAAVISACWHQDPAQRPPMSAVVKLLDACGGGGETSTSTLRSSTLRSWMCYDPPRYD